MRNLETKENGQGKKNEAAAASGGSEKLNGIFPGRDGAIVASSAIVGIIYCLASPIGLGEVQRLRPNSFEEPLVLLRESDSCSGASEAPCRESFGAALMKEGSFAGLDMGAMASVASVERPDHHKTALGRPGISPAAPHGARARYRFGNGRVAGIRLAPEAPVGVAGRRGKFTTLFADAEIPVCLRQRALESSGGKSDSFRYWLNLGKLGAEKLLTANLAGRHL